MTETTTRSIEHATFVLERVYPVARERVFDADRCHLLNPC
jgi:hypothetical protein